MLRQICLASLVLIAPCLQAQAEEPKSFLVATDGSGDFKTVQAAIDSLPEKNKTPVVIRIKPGIYKERINVSSNRNFITLKGEGDDPTKTTLTYDLHANSVISPATQPVGTTGSTSIMLSGDDFTAENLTFENPSGHLGQAVAVKTNGDRIVFRNCRFLGGQDTLYPNGKRTYFDRCYVEGRTDFIFGRATALFDHCTIHSKNGGFVTAPSTLPEVEFGFVFLDCKLTGEGEQKAYLGRPWRDYGSSVFIRCDMGDHIRPEGFNNWKIEREKTARFAEYMNTGKGADRSQRVAWSRELSEDEAKKYTIQNILGGDDHWDPTRK